MLKTLTKLITDRLVQHIIKQITNHKLTMITFIMVFNIAQQSANNNNLTCSRQLSKFVKKSSYNLALIPIKLYWRANITFYVVLFYQFKAV